jgi:acyl carrier protein
MRISEVSIVRLFEQLESLFRDVLNNPNLHLTRESNPFNIEAWDSFAHVNLMIAIEQQFEIRFAVEELQQFEGVGEIVDLINKKLELVGQHAAS